MKVWTSVPAAALAAVLLLSTGAARAQGSTGAPSPGEGIDIVGVERFFSAPSALGHAWEAAVQAVLERMRVLTEAEPRALLPSATPKKRAPAWTAPTPARREAAVHYVVTFQPVTLEPVTHAVADTRGERAALLGVAVGLPWSVP